MTDTYEFAKSCMPQGVELETPYVSKQWGYINDINGGIYSNNGLTLVQFDMSSIFNSNALIDVSQMYITVPIVLTTALTSNNSNGTLVAPKAGYGWSYAGLKSGYTTILHGADLTISGKTVEQFQPNLNAYTNFKLMSQMSQDDLKTLGTSLGFGEALDNPQSLKFNPTTSQGQTNQLVYPGAGDTDRALTGLVGGNGLVNNKPFAFTTPDFGDEPLTGQQGLDTYNNGYFSRLKKIVDTSVAGSATTMNLYGASAATGSTASSFLTASQLSNEFKPYFSIQNTNYGVVYDIAVIRMCDIFDSIKNFPLSKKFDGILRLYFNMGAVSSFLQTVGTAGVMVSSASTNTFTNTCPIIQSCLPAVSYPATAVGITSGLSIVKSGATSLFGGVNLATAGSQHFMPSCRVYYPQIVLKPEKLIPYISENRAKKVVYTSFLFNQFNGITSGSTYSALVQSGVSNIRGVLIIPYQSNTTNGTCLTAAVSSVSTFSSALSPFIGYETGPISLINLQVAIGGTNVLQNTLNYTFENFLEQTSLYEKINAGDLGLSCGLINEFTYSNAYRPYYVDCSRGNIGDLLTPRNVNVTFTNNSNITIDVMIFTEYYQEMLIDVESGLITR